MTHSYVVLSSWPYRPANTGKLRRHTRRHLYHRRKAVEEARQEAAKAREKEVYR